MYRGFSQQFLGERRVHRHWFFFNGHGLGIFWLESSARLSFEAFATVHIFMLKVYTAESNFSLLRMQAFVSGVLGQAILQIQHT